VRNFISIQLIGVKSNRALWERSTLEQNGDKYQKEIQSGGGLFRKATCELLRSWKAEKAEKS